MIPSSDDFMTAVKFQQITEGEDVTPLCRCGEPAVVTVFDVCCNVPMFKCGTHFRVFMVAVTAQMGAPVGCVECGRVAPLNFDLYRLEEL